MLTGDDAGDRLPCASCRAVAEPLMITCNRCIECGAALERVTWQSVTGGSPRPRSADGGSAIPRQIPEAVNLFAMLPLSSALGSSSASSAGTGAGLPCQGRAPARRFRARTATSAARRRGAPCRSDRRCGDLLHHRNLDYRGGTTITVESRGKLGGERASGSGYCWAGMYSGEGGGTGATGRRPASGCRLARRACSHPAGNSA